jgi:heterotetrameric sarcosine oxidase gamma subunit
LDLKGPGLDTTSIFSEARTWRLGWRHVLVTCQPDARAAIITSLENLEPPIYLTDVTSVYAQFLLAGPRSRDVLRKLTSLNVSDRKLPNLACAQASLAHVHALVLRQDLDRVPAFQLLITRDYAESVWESVLHAGAEFGITA